MNRLLLTAYILLIAWCVGAFSWIGKELLEQHMLFAAIKELRTRDSEEAEKNLLSVPPDAPVYLVQEIQQETYRDVRMRLVSILEKAIGKNPKELDKGHLFSKFYNEVGTLEQLLEGGLEGVDLSWMTPSIRERIGNYQKTSQIFISTEQTEQMVAEAEACFDGLWKEMPAKERKTIREHLVSFITSRWTDLPPERLDRLCDFLSSYVLLHYRRGSREERDRIVDLLIRTVRSRGEDLFPHEKEWLAAHLVPFISGQLPKAAWKERVVEIVRAYAMNGWAPLIPEEAVLLEESKKLRRLYDHQRTRFGRVFVKSVESVLAKGKDVDRVLVTELVSLLGDPSSGVAGSMQTSLQAIAAARIQRLARVLASSSLEPGEWEEKELADHIHQQFPFHFEELEDVLKLLRKKLYQESVPAVMAVETRQQTKNERREELRRRLLSARLRCATLMGEVGAAAIKQAQSITDERIRKQFLNASSKVCENALRGILGSPDADIVEAAQKAIHEAGFLLDTST